MANKLVDSKPKFFTQPVVNKLLFSNGAVLKKTGNDIADTNIHDSSSFRYDPAGSGLRSSQQLNVDFSDFSNHTFFCSAEANVNVAFQKVINEYPFDGSRKEIEAFIDSLTGFEKWVFDNFPKNLGYLNFSGSAGISSTEGNYIAVNDFAGYLYPSISKKRTGENVINPKDGSFSIELQLAPAAIANSNQIICQKLSGSMQGFSLYVSQSTSISSCSLGFSVTSGSITLSTSAFVQKGQFNHVVASYDKSIRNNNLKLYVNETLIATSTNSADMGDLCIPTSQFLIGSGVNHSNALGLGTSFLPLATYSGSIDELRVFHDVRTIKQQQLYAKKAIYADDSLKLYFKFNEPSGSIGNDFIVIDSSGNSLHALVSNLNASCRLTSSLAQPMSYENRSLSPILFPSYGEVQTFNSMLLASASAYDDENPNVITKLIPPHYMQEGQVFETFDNENGTIGDGLNGSGPPGTAQLGSSQVLASLLYVWARFFDEIKMMLDSFGTTLFVDYNKQNFAPDQMLQFIAKYYGFEMPSYFSDSSIEQFIDAENINDTISTNSTTLQYIQNQLWRRILTNIGDVINSKGTLHSINVLLRSMGIEPGKNFRLREYGGQTSRNLENARDDRRAITTFINFSGSIVNNATPTNDSRGRSSTMPYLSSPFLSSSRIEPGYPSIAGSWVNVSPNVSISNAPSDGLWTSGSWTYEGLYTYGRVITGSHALTQSIARMYVTGTLLGVSGSGGLIANLVAISGSGLVLYVASSITSSFDSSLKLPLTGVDIFDGDAWNVSFGRQRADEISSPISSSYFVRAAKQNYGKILESHTTSSKLNDISAVSVFQTISSLYNASGAYIVVGSQSVDSTAVYLGNSTFFDQTSRTTIFDGALSQLRFWSKALSLNEWYEHVLNFRSLGVNDVATNFNFVNTLSGSYQKLRMDVSCEQQVTSSNSTGALSLIDYSQNNVNISCTGFETSKSVIIPKRIFYSQLSPKFDEAASNQKVRVRSYIDPDNVSLYGAQLAPMYEIPKNEMPFDDTRFSIDFSIADALNDDIVKIFSTLNQLDNVLGNPELLFSPDYPALEMIRQVYFNRLTDNVRLKKFFEFFKWFDGMLNVSTLIQQLVPRKTRFLGTNFVIESHMLERAKLEYSSTDIYLGEDYRDTGKGLILLQQFVASVRRY